MDCLGGGFKCFLSSPLPGEMIQFDQYFSNGLKPPTSYRLVIFSQKNHVQPPRLFLELSPIFASLVAMLLKIDPPGSWWLNICRQAEDSVLALRMTTTGCVFFSSGTYSQVFRVEKHESFFQHVQHILFR